jgi:YD repeat-containing protein
LIFLLPVHPSGSAQPTLGSGYVYNAANQRTHQTLLADGSTWVYDYDSLGQVKSGKRYWADGTLVAGQQFEYGFDDIGNRSSAKTGGDALGANLRSQGYTVNDLNLYATRTNPRYLEVPGAAQTTATVQVDGSTSGVLRQGGT